MVVKGEDGNEVEAQELGKQAVSRGRIVEVEGGQERRRASKKEFIRRVRHEAGSLVDDHVLPGPGDQEIRQIVLVDFRAGGFGGLVEPQHLDGHVKGPGVGAPRAEARQFGEDFWRRNNGEACRGDLIQQSRPPGRMVVAVGARDLDHKARDSLDKVMLPETGQEAVEALGLEDTMFEEDWQSECADQPRRQGELLQGGDVSVGRALAGR